MRKGMPTGRMEEETKELLDYYMSKCMIIESKVMSNSIKFEIKEERGKLQAINLKRPTK